MKNILIIYPHWPPSNLAGVHRARLISNFLPDFNWHPIVLTVHEDFYEEKPDYDFLKTVRPSTEVIKVAAKPVNKSSRLVGDIALRAFGALKRKAIELIREREIDFLWVPIPSFYSAIIARKVHNATQIPYGIDYIDPWVDSFVGQEKLFSKAWLSNQVAKWMEPYAVKKASLISGVDEAYYQPVLKRNFANRKIAHVGMPYGFDPLDHEVRINQLDYPWKAGTKAYVYAGALLPKSIPFLKLLFKSIKTQIEKGEWDSNKKLYFLGTSRSTEYSIEDYAKQYEIDEVVFEYQSRFPFLHILNFLSASEGVMVLGSTEQHYTASKIFQTLLSRRPLFGVFHHRSSAVQIMQACRADDYLVQYKERVDDSFKQAFEDQVVRFFSLSKGWEPDLSALDSFSAKASTKALVEKIEEVI